MKCYTCKKEITKPSDSISTGYATDPANHKICYECVGESDKKWMRDNIKTTLYLITKPDYEGSSYGQATITNWPASLKLTGRYHKGRHNIAGTRYDVWFEFEGQPWHGVQYGDMTQILHCKKIGGAK